MAPNRGEGLGKLEWGSGTTVVSAKSGQKMLDTRCCWPGFAQVLEAAAPPSPSSLALPLLGTSSIGNNAGLPPLRPWTSGLPAHGLGISSNAPDGRDKLAASWSPVTVGSVRSSRTPTSARSHLRQESPRVRSVDDELPMPRWLCREVNKATSKLRQVSELTPTALGRPSILSLAIDGCATRPQTVSLSSQTCVAERKDEGSLMRAVRPPFENESLSEDWVRLAERRRKQLRMAESLGAHVGRRLTVIRQARLEVGGDHGKETGPESPTSIPASATVQFSGPSQIAKDSSHEAPPAVIREPSLRSFPRRSAARCAAACRRGESLGARLRRHVRVADRESGIVSTTGRGRSCDRVSVLRQKLVGTIAQEKVGTVNTQKKDGSASLVSSTKASASDDEMWSTAFRKLQDDGQLHRDELPAALRLVGLIPEESWIDEVYPTVTKWTSLTRDDFFEFVRRYLKHQSEAYSASFLSCDTDGSGKVEAAELVNLLKDFGIEPMEHVLDELVREVDADGEGLLDRSEFDKLLELLRSREGFTRKECDSFMVAYRRFDRDSSGDIDVKELISILTWLGFSPDGSNTAEILRQVDVDNSGSINEREFLICMRKVREREIARIQDVIRRSDTDRNEMISISEIGELLRALGYVPDMDAVFEAAEDAGVDLRDPTIELNLSAVWRLLTIFRQREGFSAEDAAEISGTFVSLDTGKQGEISTVMVRRALRMLDVTLRIEVVESYIAIFDIDGSGLLNISELLKLLRVFRDKDRASAMETFCQSSSLVEGELLLDVTKTPAVFKQLGCMDPHGMTLRPLPEDLAGVPVSTSSGMCSFINMQGFMRVFLRGKKISRQFRQMHNGFSAAEVAEMKRSFDYYDQDVSGDLKLGELVDLVEDVLPHMAHDPNMRPKLRQILKQAIGKSDGTMHFEDFLRLMQFAYELQDESRDAKVTYVMRQTCFLPHEINGYRELFLAIDHGSGFLTFDDVKGMLNTISPLGDKLAGELEEHFCAAIAEQRTLEDQIDCEELDFPEFLWLMKKLLDMNFASLKEKSG
eukprot:TRINITY_DN73939_c0_g1_i1.p1 TRINITY_DN73939_c0_g1~~TRINITY_DN73939_c0_g1_i1.p1  ORF type:complete len:1041 (-),score=166.53 TRINITY_DN73939_c0_g1_i1:149-3271(-)